MSIDIEIGRIDMKERLIKNFLTFLVCSIVSLIFFVNFATAGTFSLDTVKQYAPLVHLYGKERYFPCGIEYLLQNSELKHDGDWEFQLRNPTQADLQKYCEKGYYVDINLSQFGGMREKNRGVTAPMYYAVQEYEDAVQISYLMLYAYQGGQTCRALRSGTEFNFIANKLGIHQGDLERVVVTLTPKGPGQYRVVSVGYEAHGVVTYYKPRSVSWEDDTHPVVNVALNGHASYNMFKVGKQITHYKMPGILAVIDRVSNGGVVWRPYVSSKFKHLGLDYDGNPIGDQIWSVFRGRLGKKQENKFVSATYFDGSNLKSYDWHFVKIIDWGARLFDKYPEDLKKGYGPRGPGARSWVKPVPPGELAPPELMVNHRCPGFDANRDFRNLLTGDVNGDGKTDLILQAGTKGGECGNGQVGIYLSTY